MSPLPPDYATSDLATATTLQQTDSCSYSLVKVELDGTVDKVALENHQAVQDHSSVKAVDELRPDSWQQFKEELQRDHEEVGRVFAEWCQQTASLSQLWEQRRTQKEQDDQRKEQDDECNAEQGQRIAVLGEQVAQRAAYEYVDGPFFALSDNVSGVSPLRRV